MNQDLLTPIKDSVAARTVHQSISSLGQNIQIYLTDEGFPDLENIQIAIFGVQEDRNSQKNYTNYFQVNGIQMLRI
jgi:formiminoglutamase